MSYRAYWQGQAVKTAVLSISQINTVISSWGGVVRTHDSIMQKYCTSVEVQGGYIYCTTGIYFNLSLTSLLKALKNSFPIKDTE